MRLWLLLAAALAFGMATVSVGTSRATGEAPDPALEMLTWEAEAAPDEAQVLADIREQQARVGGAWVFPPDERFAITDTTRPLWRTITLLLIYDRFDDLQGTCSGVFLSHNVVLTAAHCIYFDGGYAYSIVAAPGATNDAPVFGLADAARMAVPVGWADGPGQDPADAPGTVSKFDWGIVVFNGDPFQGRLAPYPFMAHAPDEFFEAATTNIATAGFPGDKPFGTMWAATSLEYVVDDDFLLTYMDIYQGQSGSPIFAMDDNDFFIFSVVSLGTPAGNLSVRFIPKVLDALENYCAELGCSIKTYFWVPDETPAATPTKPATPTQAPTKSPTPKPASPTATPPSGPASNPGGARPFRVSAPLLSRD